MTYEDRAWQKFAKVVADNKSISGKELAMKTYAFVEGNKSSEVKTDDDVYAHFGRWKTIVK